MKELISLFRSILGISDADHGLVADKKNVSGRRWGMVIDLSRCSGCQACVVACKVENNVGTSSAKEADEGRSIEWMSLLPFEEEEYPYTRRKLMPSPCMQCDNPPCIKVCPVGATYMNPEGLVGQVYNRCIGCRYCSNNCPYTCKFFNWTEPEFPGELIRGTNPDVSIRPLGVIEKCTFCHHRLVQGREQAAVEGRDLEPRDYVPACVSICPAKAMYFGDLNDPDSEVSHLARSPRMFRLQEDIGAEPKVIYLQEKA